MRIAVVGSRDYSSYEEVKKLIQRISARYPDAEFVSGGCRGVDSWAIQCARVLGHDTFEYKVVEVKRDGPFKGKFFTSYQFTLADGGAGINPMCNNVTGTGFYDTFRECAMKRNGYVVKADVVVAVWDGFSRGTYDSVKKAQLAGTLVCVYREGRWVV